jgi:chromosome segregation ATPase
MAATRWENQMFSHQRTTKLKNDIRKLEDERDGLTDDNRKVKDELAELKQKRKMEDEDIRHLVKIKESQLDLAHQKKQVELEGEFQTEKAKIKDEYRDKLESTLQNQIKDVKGMYGEILKRLPNVNVRLKGDV